MNHVTPKMSSENLYTCLIYKIKACWSLISQTLYCQFEMIHGHFVSKYHIASLL